MKKLILFYLCFCIAIIAGLQVQKDPGYVLIAIKHWTIEMPLWFFVISLFIIIGCVHYSLNTLHQLGSLRYRFMQYIKSWRNKSSLDITRQGLIAFSEGNWLSAEKKLLKGLPSSDSPLINYLTAAKAAQEMGKLHKRDKYLCEAEKSMPDTKIAVLLTQAELQLASKQFEQANATLKRLNHLVPKHPHVLKLMLSLYKDLDDWKEMESLLPKLSRNKVISSNEQFQLEKNILLKRISALDLEGDKTQLLSLWSPISKKLKADRELVHFYASHLIKHKETGQAEAVLRQSIKKNFSSSLIELYGQLDDIDRNKQLKFAESLIRSYSNSASLYQALGIISKKLQLWGKSKAYLERSSELAPTKRTYYELGELYRQLNDESSACAGFKNGLQLAIQPN